MSLPGLVAQIWLSMVGTDNSRLVGQQPAVATVGVVTTCGKAVYGAWAQIVVTATITSPSWLWGMEVSTPAIDADVASADTDHSLEIGVGAAGAEVALVEARYSLHHIKLTAVGEWSQLIAPLAFPRPLRIATANTRIASRGGTPDCANTHAISVSAMLGTLFGT